MIGTRKRKKRDANNKRRVALQETHVIPVSLWQCFLTTCPFPRSDSSNSIRVTQALKQTLQKRNARIPHVWRVGRLRTKVASILPLPDMFSWMNRVVSTMAQIRRTYSACRTCLLCIRNAYWNVEWQHADKVTLASHSSNRYTENNPRMPPSEKSYRWNSFEIRETHERKVRR